MAARRSRRSSPAPRKPKKRARLVAPHPSAGRGKCSSCGRWHTKSEHWSHKANAGAKSYRKKRGVAKPSSSSKRHRVMVDGVAHHFATAGEARAYRIALAKRREPLRKALQQHKAVARRLHQQELRAEQRADAPRFSGSDAQKRAVSRQRKASKEAFLAGVKAGKRDAARRAA